MATLEFLGADPELFLKEKKTGELVSAHGLIPGTKKNPHKIPHGAVQVDGMAAEFNIDPARTAKDFVHNIMEVMNELRKMVPDHELVIEPCVTFSKKVWDSVPKEAKILGCDPDYNAYTGELNKTPNSKVSFRTAAGHVHFGWCTNADPKNPGHFQACRILARELDYWLAMPASLLSTSEGAIKRRKLYGQPGAFRPKPYGMEYRVLDNSWLQSPELIKWVFNQCHTVFKNLSNKVFYHQKMGPYTKAALQEGRVLNPWIIEELQNYQGMKFPPDYQKYMEQPEPLKPGAVETMSIYQYVRTKSKLPKHNYTVINDDQVRVEFVGAR